MIWIRASTSGICLDMLKSHTEDNDLRTSCYAIACDKHTKIRKIINLAKSPFKNQGGKEGRLPLRLESCWIGWNITIGNITDL